MRIAPEKIEELKPLVAKFISSYPSSDAGRHHVSTYDAARKEARANLADIRARADQGEDVTDDVLLKLLPYAETKSNKAAGAWAHIAPAIAGSLRKKFENVGWTAPSDWPLIAQDILLFVVNCTDNPSVLANECKRIDEQPHMKGFQTGFLTPILNALRPDDFAIINNKARRVYGYLASGKLSQKILEYPTANEAAHAVLGTTADMLDVPELAGMLPCDRLDMLVHWLAAIEKVDWARGGVRKRDVLQYWKISPGGDAWNWESCREGGFIAIGWDDLGDMTDMSRQDFLDRRDELVEEKDDWTKAGTDQAWSFHKIPEGSIIVANHGTSKVLGIGRVTAQYYFVDGERHGHRLPVEWFDQTPRSVSEGGWRRTMVKLTKDKVDEILHKQGHQGAGGEVHEAPAAWMSDSEPLFPKQTFDLMTALNADLSKSFYNEHKAELKELVSERLKLLMADVAGALPENMLDVLETRKRIRSNILKQGQTGDNACSETYWAAFYPVGRKRVFSSQLFVGIHEHVLRFGFGVGSYPDDEVDVFLGNVERYSSETLELAKQLVADTDFVLGGSEDPSEAIEPREWIDDLDEDTLLIARTIPASEAAEMSRAELTRSIVDGFVKLFPFFRMTLEEGVSPKGALPGGDGHAQPTDGGVQPTYTLEDFVAETGFESDVIESWERQLLRKNHVIFQGPPGTGKTFVARRLAQMLISDTTGISDLVQFHPSYAYEDFIQGIRPEVVEGGLSYDLAPGRFLEFCDRVQRVSDGAPCVLLIDEINRAHLSRVFGELMYLLEYRDQAIPLAAGGESFRIPPNVYIVGTMNTADRSIALVDHALRRRFSFIRLQPEYEVLRRHLEAHDLEADSLVSALCKVNNVIGDPNYELGISYFMKDGEDLPGALPDIWEGEIVPYLEEYFYDRPDKVDMFRWELLADGELSDWVE